MKFVWEPSDIVAGVRFVNKTELHTDRVCEIGWLAFESNANDRGHPLVIIDHCDGMVHCKKSPDEIAKHLTESGAIPLELVESIRARKKGGV